MIQEMNISRLACYADIFVKTFNNPPWSESWTAAQAQQRIEDVMNTPHFIGWELVQSDQVSGFIMGNLNQSFDGWHCEIKEFCVDTSIQGSGLGTALLNAYLAELETRDIQSVFLLTARGPRTEGFYAKRGFRVSPDMIMMGR